MLLPTGAANLYSCQLSRDASIIMITESVVDSMTIHPFYERLLINIPVVLDDRLKCFRIKVFLSKGKML